MPTAEDLHRYASRARESSTPGLDGWKPAELKRLPLAAWKKRKLVLDLAVELKKWPSPYYVVSAPALTKIDKLDPNGDRQQVTPKTVRLLSIYTQLYRIEAGAWFVNHREWLKRNVDESWYGGLPGLEALMASWDSQMDLEEATDQGKPFLLAFLDYYKFFDSFEAEFVGELFSKLGIHSNLVEMFVNLNKLIDFINRRGGCAEEYPTEFDA